MAARNSARRRFGIFVEKHTIGSYRLAVSKRRRSGLRLATIGTGLDRMRPGAGSAGSKAFRETSVPGNGRFLGNEVLQEMKRSGKRSAPGNQSVPGNEGVGEHVRTRFQSGLWPGEIADRKIRTERRKPVSSAGPFLRERTLSNNDPTV